MKTLNEKELKQVNGGMWTAEETGRKIGNVARQAARQDYPVFDSPFKSWNFFISILNNLVIVFILLLKACVVKLSSSRTRSRTIW